MVMESMISSKFEFKNGETIKETSLIPRISSTVFLLCFVLNLRVETTTVPAGNCFGCGQFLLFFYGNWKKDCLNSNKKDSVKKSCMKKLFLFKESFLEDNNVQRIIDLQKGKTPSTKKKKWRRS